MFHYFKKLKNGQKQDKNKKKKGKKMPRNQPTSVVEVWPFEERKLPPCGFCVISGKRGGGKTSLARHLARSRVDAYTGIAMAMCGSQKVLQNWKKVIQPSYVFDPSCEKLQEIIDGQNKLVELYGENNFPPELKIKLVLDDCGTLRWFMHSAQLKYIAANGRHLFIDVVLVAQYLYQLATEIRENIDYLFMFRTGNIKNVKTIHAEFLTCTELRVVAALMKDVTKNFGCLVINNVNSQSIHDACFAMKVKNPDIPKNPEDPPEPFIGDPKLVYWAEKHSKEAMDKQEAEFKKEEEEDLANNEDNSSDDTLCADLGTLIDDPNKMGYEDRFGRIIIRLKKDKCD